MVRDNASYESEAVGFRRADLATRENQVCSGSHPDQVGQRDQRNRRETTKLDLRLAKLGRFRGEDKIAKCSEFHASTQTISMDASDYHAICFGETAKNAVKCGEHPRNTLGRMIRNIHTR
jgi:hypothetical protein